MARISKDVEIWVEGVEGVGYPAVVKGDGAGGVVMARISKDVEIGVEGVGCPVVLKGDGAEGIVMARI
jgi:hypothetical protein